MTIKARASGLPVESLRELELSQPKACVTGQPADSLGLLILSLSKTRPINDRDTLLPGNLTSDPRPSKLPPDPRRDKSPPDTCPATVPDTLENDRDNLNPCSPAKPSLAFSESGSSSHFRPSQAYL